MSEVFARIQEKTAGGDLPALDDAQSLVRLARQMEVQAEDDWVGEAQDFSHLTQQLLQAVKNAQPEDALMIAESLDDAQSYCHRMFQL